MVVDGHVLHVHQVVDTEEFLRLRDALFGEDHRLSLFVERVVRLVFQAGNETVGARVQVRRLFERPDMISGVRASSIRIESTSSTIA